MGETLALQVKGPKSGQNLCSGNIPTNKAEWLSPLRVMLIPGDPASTWDSVGVPGSHCSWGLANLGGLHQHLGPWCHLDAVMG